MCGATSLKIIKYKTLPYNISNHSIYKFIFAKKKKSKRYSNSTQFKFFFSSFNFPKEEFQKRETLWGDAANPRGLLGSLTVHHQFGVCLPRVTLARTFECGRYWELCSFEGQVNVKCPDPTSLSLAVFHKTQPLLDQEILFLRRYPFHLPCPDLLVFS